MDKLLQKRPAKLLAFLLGVMFNEEDLAGTVDR